MPLVYLKLTNAQYAGLSKGKGVRMNPSAQSSGEIYGVEMSAPDYKRYSKALLSGKGCIVKGTISDKESDEEMSEEVEGGKVNWKKVGRQIKKVANTIGVDAIEGTKKYVPQDVAKNFVQGATTGAVLAGTTYLGAPNPQLAMAAGKASGSAVDAGYKTDFRKRDALKQFGKNFVQDAQQEAISTALTGGLSGGKLNVRKAARQVKKFANKYGADALETVKNVPKDKLKEAVKSNVQSAVLNATNDEQLASRAARYSDRIIDAGYNTNFKRKTALRDMGNELQDVKQEMIDYGLQQMSGGDLQQTLKVRKMREKVTGKPTGTITDVNGTPVSKKRFQKGSEEAKQYMASLRANRRSGSNVAQKVNAIESRVQMGGSGMKPLGSGIVPLGGKGIVPL